MQKEIHIFREVEGEDYARFQSRMLGQARELAMLLVPGSLRITLSTGPPPRLSVIPFRRDKIAAISIAGSRTSPLEITAKMDGFTGAYRVEEAIPVAYEKSWADGTATPGVCLLTLFHQKPGISREQFMSRWYEGHTPLSLRLHPLYNYNRNVVTGELTGTSPWFDGIVEEQVREKRDLLNPLRFFGPPLKVLGHMLEVWKDSRGFIDMKRIETYLANEVHIVS